MPSDFLMQELTGIFILSSHTRFSCDVQLPNARVNWCLHSFILNKTPRPPLPPPFLSSFFSSVFILAFFLLFHFPPPRHQCTNQSLWHLLEEKSKYSYFPSLTFSSFFSYIYFYLSLFLILVILFLFNQLFTLSSMLTSFNFLLFLPMLLFFLLLSIRLLLSLARPPAGNRSISLTSPVPLVRRFLHGIQVSQSGKRPTGVRPDPEHLWLRL